MALIVPNWLPIRTKMTLSRVNERLQRGFSALPNLIDKFSKHDVTWKMTAWGLMFQNDFWCWRCEDCCFAIVNLPSRHCHGNHAMTEWYIRHLTSCFCVTSCMLHKDFKFQDRSKDDGRLNVSMTARALTNNIQNYSWRPWWQSTTWKQVKCCLRLPSQTSTVVLNIIHQCVCCRPHIQSPVVLTFNRPSSSLPSLIARSLLPNNVSNTSELYSMIQLETGAWMYCRSGWR